MKPKSPLFRGQVVRILLICSKKSEKSSLIGLSDAAPEPVDEALAARLLESANKILDTLTAANPPSSNGRTPNLPASVPPLSTLAVKRLRASLRNFSPSTADELSDLLLASLLPSARPLSYPAKLHHLSLLQPSERVAHALAQLEILKTELESREAVGTRYVTNMQRRTREMVLRGLLEAIRQELYALRKMQGDDDGDNEGKSGTIRIVRSPGSSGPNSPRSPPADEEEEDELAVLETKINESSMPDDARLVANREMRRLKSIPPQSVEHGGIRNYLDWLTDLPWATSSYDDNEGNVIDKHFLERARRQLVSPRACSLNFLEMLTFCLSVTFYAGRRSFWYRQGQGAFVAISRDPSSSE